MNKGRITIHELTPLEIHNYRYSDKYMHKARIDALHSRMLCPSCGTLIFKYDPDNHDYIKCHKCGARKRNPINIAKFTPDWGNEQRRKDGFEYLFGEQSSALSVNEVK